MVNTLKTMSELLVSVLANEKPVRRLATASSSYASFRATEILARPDICCPLGLGARLTL